MDNNLPNIGIQLYTVRDLMAENLPLTIQRIADIGYKEVEFAGYFGKTSKEIKTILSDNGLKSPSTHIEMDAIYNNPNKAIETALEVGHEYIVMAWLSESERQNIDQYREYVDIYNLFGEKCNQNGLKFAYHNHDFEFNTLDGEVPMDLLLDKTDPDNVLFELDMYWVNKAKKDPKSYINRYPGRFPLWHIKDMASNTMMADVGDGVINFSEIFSLSNTSGLKHYFVERDDPSDSILSAERSYNAMLKLDF
jgi:sugar phosphate isomerase/epimerase